MVNGKASSPQKLINGEKCRHYWMKEHPMELHAKVYVNSVVKKRNSQAPLKAYCLNLL